MNLYEIGQNYQYLLGLLTDEETDQQMILDTLESIEGEFEDKADNYARIIKALESEAAALKDEEARLRARRQSRESNIRLLKNNLESIMKAIGKTNFKTLLFNFGIVKNGGKAPIKITVPVQEIPNEFFKRTEKELDNEKIRKALEEGEISFASYEERGESLRIK